MKNFFKTPQIILSNGGSLQYQKVKNEVAYNTSVSGGFVPNNGKSNINFMQMYKEDSKKSCDKQNLLIVLTKVYIAKSMP